MAIVWVGVGTGDADQLTRRAWDVLTSADRLVVQDHSLLGLARSVTATADRPGGVPVEVAEGRWWATASGLVAFLVRGDGLGPFGTGGSPAGEPRPVDDRPPLDDIVVGVAADAEERAVRRLVEEGVDLASARPLRGLTVVVTRAAEQAGGLATPLVRLGARVVELPTIRIGEPADGGAGLDAALASPSRYDWVVVTSVNGARAVSRRVPDARRLAGVRLAAIGPATAQALAEAHLPPDLVPPRFVAESLLEVFPSGSGRVLLARAAVARDVLPDGLRERGWTVDVVEAYRTAPARPADDALERLAGADVACFTAPSTFEQFLELAGRSRLAPAVACIGPVTAAAVRAAGITPAVVAPVHTIPGLVDALITWARNR
jgi:uroporphyrinogen-III synthase